eukprot:Phypoly_transcript_12213.p1 GENE.Phypoly_transcript_12213~~Phypoly_transcript_12213.p1  ORF type:complete len:206 (+),score=27.40 Phypoly_transcript_12213:439-1056(+)
MPLATRIINHEEALSVETTTIDGLESDLQFFTLPITFCIHSKNPSGSVLKRGGERFAIKILGPPPTHTRVPSKVLDKRDGDYNVTFEPTQPGKHTIAVTHYGRQLAGSPFTIDVEEAADSETSSMVKFMFKVQARNTSGKAKKKGGDKFEVFIVGPEGPVENLQVSDIKDGSYLIQWAPNEPGEYWIDATLNSNTVSGFPWGVVI